MPLRWWLASCDTFARMKIRRRISLPQRPRAVYETRRTRRTLAAVCCCPTAALPPPVKERSAPNDLSLLPARSENSAYDSRLATRDSRLRARVEEPLTTHSNWLSLSPFAPNVSTRARRRFVKIVTDYCYPSMASQRWVERREKKKCKLN